MTTLARRGGQAVRRPLSGDAILRSRLTGAIISAALTLVDGYEPCHQGPGVAALVTLDESGRVLYASEESGAMLGLRGEEAVGQVFAELLTEPNREGIRDVMSRLSIPSLVDRAHRIEISVLHRDGRKRWLDVLITRSGKATNATVWLLDVTDENAAGMAAEHRLALMERSERVAEIGSWEWLPDTRELVWSDNLYRLLGLQPGEIRPTPEDVLSRIHPDDRRRVLRLAASLGEEGNAAPVECRIVMGGQSTRRMRATITAGATAGSIIGVVEDVTDEASADRIVTTHVAVSDALQAWDRLEDGAQRLLSDLAEALDFDVAALWVPLRDALVPRVLWSASGHDLSGFEAVTRSLRPRRGVCLPGRAWQAGEPINVLDVQAYPAYARRDAAGLSGLRGAVAIPALHGDEVLAVVEITSRAATGLGGRMMLSLRAIGHEIGAFLFHRPAELRPSLLTPRQLEVLRLASEGRSGREIAAQLFISPTTVKSHFKAIYEKLGVEDRAAAVAVAMRRGLIQ